MYDDTVSHFQKMIYSRSMNIIMGIFLAGLWARFAYQHILAYTSTHETIFLFFCFSETLQSALFLFRSIPKTVSLDLFDWFAAIGGTFFALLFRPTSMILWNGGQTLVVIGIILQIAGLISINRSFALVPAMREIKISGLYQFVRHPIYLSYAILYTGYVLFSFSYMNLLCYVTTLLFFVVRIIEEEKHLSTNVIYRSYAEKVRFRIIPFVF